MQELLEIENDYVKDLGLVVDVSIYINIYIYLIVLYFYFFVGKINMCWKYMYVIYF